MKQKLVIFLQNLYNSPWHRQFDAGGFVVGEDLKPLKDSNEIETLDEDQLVGMSQALLIENAELKGTAFYNDYIFPLYQTLKEYNHAPDQT